MLGDLLAHHRHRLAQLVAGERPGGPERRAGGERHRAARRRRARRPAGGPPTSASLPGRAGFPASTNARMSSLVTRPWRPVPVTAPGRHRARRRSGGPAARSAGAGVLDSSSVGVVCFTGAAAAAGLRGRHRAGARQRRPRGGGRGRAGAAVFGAGPTSPASPACGDHADDGFDGDGRAGAVQDLRQLAAGRGGHLGVHLVGGDLEQRLVLGDILALVLEPADDGPLGDRLAHLRHHDVDWHLVLPLLNSRLVQWSPARLIPSRLPAPEIPRCARDDLRPRTDRSQMWIMGPCTPSAASWIASWRVGWAWMV